MPHLPIRKSGGAFRRVRFALACRTEPLVMILHQNQVLVMFFLLLGLCRMVPPNPETGPRYGNTVTRISLVSACWLLPRYPGICINGFPRLWRFSRTDRGPARDEPETVALPFHGTTGGKLGVPRQTRIRKFG